MGIPEIPTKKVRAIDHVEAGRIAKEYRESRGVSLRQLADEMNLSFGYVGRLERQNTDAKHHWTDELWEAYFRGVRKVYKRKKRREEARLAEID